MKYCPSPGCEFIIINPRVGAGTTDVFCDCGYGFCFKCNKDAHVPLDCYYRDLFEQKMKEDSGASDNSELWVKVNTKKCPKCQTPIQKNQGCMHMTCGKCKYEFCWLCMGDYWKHSAETGVGLCGSYADVVKFNRANVGEIEERIRLDWKMRKFAHYATWYNEHLRSVDLDKKRGEQL